VLKATKSARLKIPIALCRSSSFPLPPSHYPSAVPLLPFHFLSFFSSSPLFPPRRPLLFRHCDQRPSPRVCIAVIQRTSNISGFQFAEGSVASPRTWNGNLLPWQSGLAASKRTLVAVAPLRERRHLMDDSWKPFRCTDCMMKWATFPFLGCDDLMLQSYGKMKLGMAEQNRWAYRKDSNHFSGPLSRLIEMTFVLDIWQAG